jgi:hypothetical protein
VTTESAKRPSLLFAGAIALLALGGCHDKSDPSNVERRAVERWKFLAAHEAEKAYDYLTPGARATQTRDAYATAMNNRPVQWKDAKFKDKECDADRCKIHVDVTYAVSTVGMGGQRIESTRTQSEVWIFADGDWYYLPN